MNRDETQYYLCLLRHMLSTTQFNMFVERIKPLTAYNVPAACIGISTAKLAEKFDFKNVILPEQFTLKDMMSELEKYFA